MKASLLEKLDNWWHLVMETSHSQKFLIFIGKRPDMTVILDVHYLALYDVYATISLIGEKKRFDDMMRSSLFSDLKEIIYQKSGKYQVIAYTLTFSPTLISNTIPI